MNFATFVPPTTSTSCRATPPHTLNWGNETLTAYALNVIHHEQGRTFVATMHVVPELIKSHWTNPINYYPRGTRELLLVDNLLTLGAWHSGRGIQRGGFKSNKQINCIRIHSESVVRDQNVTGRIQIQCTWMWVANMSTFMHCNFWSNFFLLVRKIQISGHLLGCLGTYTWSDFYIHRHVMALRIRLHLVVKWDWIDLQDMAYTPQEVV